MSSALGLGVLLLLLIGTVVPRHADFRPDPAGVPVFVVSNGLHTDVVLPVRDARTGIDWRAGLPPADSATWRRFADYSYAAFGWGNERFYLESYGGHFPRASTVARALLPGPALMHVDFYRQPPRPGKRVARVMIPPAQYRRLAAYVAAAFAADSAGHWVPRTQRGYSAEDFFFYARGSYHALRTCNDWTNQALAQARIRSALKAPFAASVLYQVQQAP